MPWRPDRLPSLLATLLLAANCAAPAAADRDAPASQPAATTKAPLRIEVTDLRRREGQLVFGVFTSADGFPSVSGKSVNWQVKAADADTVVFTADLPPGTYGASVLHDQNANGRM